MKPPGRLKARRRYTANEIAFLVFLSTRHSNENIGDNNGPLVEGRSGIN